MKNTSEMISALRMVITSWFKTACLLVLAQLWCLQAIAATNLTFCFQDTEFAPYYLGAGTKVQTERPGATIEHLQKITTQIPDLTVTLVRYPWQRCLKYLKSGEVDAVVANYAENRRQLGMFPMRHNQPDPSREFTRQDICLVTSKELAKKWNGKSFIGMTKVTLAHQAGRKLQQSLPHRQFVKIPISVQARALQMLAQNKVQVISMVCKIAGKSALPGGFNSDTMQLLEPSIEVLHGHLVFSHRFYRANRPIAEALWSALTEPQRAIYLKYLNNND